MEVDCIPFASTGYFSKIVNDYLVESKKIKPFYQYSPQLSSFDDVIRNKSFSGNSRKVLSKALITQYTEGKIKLDKLDHVNVNIQLLNDSNTYTITTGHQLCLYTGPLYFVYKIVSVINLCKQLKSLHPEKNFVPIYWMATEDHDFAEVNHFYFEGNKIEWNTEQEGAVGRMNLKGLDAVYSQFESLLQDFSGNAEELKSLFKKAYLDHKNLADATRFLVNELFHEEGLVILDGDDSELKSLFSSIMEDELLHEVSSEKVGKTNDVLEKEYKIQVSPREINLFYLSENSRERIVRDGKDYRVNETDISFTEEQILEELKNKPENFSPNVLLRPVYQECILPNLAYIGGGGELAYWFQLKSSFEHFKISMPMLLLRNSVMWFDQKQKKYFKDLDLNLKELFEREGDLTKKWVVKTADDDLTLSEERVKLSSLYDNLVLRLNKEDRSLAEHTEAIKTKQLKELEKISEKYIRSNRKKSAVSTQKITHLKNTLFPSGGLQERKDNFSLIYARMGSEMIQVLLENLEMPSKDFTVFKA
jgi:bacillithiol biosynthesis cysteine-adding enzyme BshC